MNACGLVAGDRLLHRLVEEVMTQHRLKQPAFKCDKGKTRIYADCLRGGTESTVFVLRNILGDRAVLIDDEWLYWK